MLNHAFRLSSLLLAFALTASVAFAEDAASPFNGKDLTGWKTKGAAGKSKWAVGTAVLDAKDAREVANAKEGSDLVQHERRGRRHFQRGEVRRLRHRDRSLCPRAATAASPVMGEYEVQVFDSFGKKPEAMGSGDMGAIYSAAKPTKNQSRSPANGTST